MNISNENIIRRIIRKALSTPSDVPGYLNALGRLRAKGVVVFMYHGVAEYPLDVSNWCLLDIKEFERQMRFLADNFFVMHLDDAIKRLQNGKLIPSQAACITFDDGFRSVATRAFPILYKYQLPATVFLVTSYVGGRQPAWPDKIYYNIANTHKNEVTFQSDKYLLEKPKAKAVAFSSIVSRLKEVSKAECDYELFRLLSDLGDHEVPEDAEVASLNWDEIKELSNSGLVSFGSHTQTHPILSACPLDVQRAELEKSRDILREHGLSFHLFAYPNGRAKDFTNDTKTLLYDLGYECGLSTIVGANKHGDDIYAMKRVGVGDTTIGKKFEFAALGF